MSPFASSLARLHEELGWPHPDDVLAPVGAASAMYAKLARQKIESGLRCSLDGRDVRVSVLMENSASTTSEAPLAIVCIFAEAASRDAVREAHRLSWNFCHAPLLIVLDPYRIEAFSCYVAPAGFLGGEDERSAAIPHAAYDVGPGKDLAAQAAGSLDWLSLITGELIKRGERQFQPDGRADRTLLANLKVARERLVRGQDPLPADLAHDLLARLMFVQFLFDRRDAAGASALDAAELGALHRSGVLRKSHDRLSDILSDRDDTYALFRWLNDRFNGDLFPAKSPDPEEREREWYDEMRLVTDAHLAILRDLVAGNLDIGSGQMGLWRLYSFDALPLEFVSSIYEEFVSSPPSAERKRTGGRAKSRGRPAGVHYTPTHLADFVLDGVLPWDGTDWNLRILDPACGSGVFLVRAFQRLAYRWRRANRNREIPVDVLVRLLSWNLVGVDVNRQAARVASFSLYLAMCDEIDPRKYWSGVQFPSLRGKTIIPTDFFLDWSSSLGAGQDARFDLVVGNAPWGERTLGEPAQEYAKRKGWPTRNGDVGSLFIARAMEYCVEGGRLAMLQSAGTLLNNANSPDVRRAVFGVGRVDEIVNFTVTRRRLFPSAESPACLIVMTAGRSSDRPFTYVSPKLLHSAEDGFRISVDDLDVHEVLPSEIDDPWIWSVLTAGTRRDYELLVRIRSRGTTLRAMVEAGHVTLREGVIPSESAPAHPTLRDRRVLFAGDFPEGTFLQLDPERLPLQRSIHSHRMTDAAAFSPPQLIIKQTRRKEAKKFKAALVLSGNGVVCSQSYVSVSAIDPDGIDALRSACAMFNSRLATYYLSLTTGRMAYRPELRVDDVRDLPLPRTWSQDLSEVDGPAQLDELAERAFGLRGPEIALIEDALAHAVPELVREGDSAGRARTRRSEGGGSRDTLEDYCETFLKVIGRNGRSATVFDDANAGALPIRLVAIHLANVDGWPISRQDIGMGRLRRMLASLAISAPGRSNFVMPRVLTATDVSIGPTGNRIPTVYLARPDQVRFWSRSSAMRDADRLVAQGLDAAVRYSRGGAAAKSEDDIG